MRLDLDTKDGVQLMRIGFTDQRLTAHGGLAVGTRFITEAGLRDQLAAVLPHAPSSPNAYDPVDTALGFIGGILCGADKLARIAHLAHDPAAAQVLGIEAVPSQSTFSRFFAACGRAACEELGGLHAWALRALPARAEGRRQSYSVARYSAAEKTPRLISRHSLCDGQSAHQRNRPADHRLTPRFWNHPQECDRARIESRVPRHRPLRRARSQFLGATKEEALAWRALTRLPLATQTTDGQFTAGLRQIAKELGVVLAPALSCQSFPQTLAALKSGRFWSIVPELAIPDLAPNAVHRLDDPALKHLEREAMLGWNPRLVRVRPNAAKIATRLQHILAI